MSENGRTLLYVLLAVAFGLIAWVARPAPVERGVVEDTGQLFFPDFTDPLDAASLEIIEFDEDTSTPQAFKVARHDGVWSIPSHENYPADAENRFAEATAALIGLDKGSWVSDRPADHELFGVVDPGGAGPGATGVGKRVTIRTDQERALGDLIIGKAVKGSGTQHYVRVPGVDRVYLATIDTDRFSTRFEDWIEKDLLKLTPSDATGIVINDYAIDEFSKRLIQGETLNLSYDRTAATWSLEGLGPDEQLDRTKLNALRRALDDLEIIDVHRKPSGLSSELRAEDTLQLDREAVQSLRDRGFYIAQGSLLSNQGETIVQMVDGVQYTLRFGEVALAPGGAGEGADDGKGRYLFVTAEFNPDLLPAPDLLAVPEIPPELVAKVEAAGGEGEGDEADKDLAASLAAARVKAEADNAAKQAEYDARVAEARTHASVLNDRFADWYYVISDETYGKIRLSRQDVILPVEPAEEEG